MYFAKNEIIELANHQKYLVTDSKEINNIYYYQISDITNLKNDKSYVTAKMKDGKIYIDYNIDSEILNELKA
ncbi:MAG: hypothetical protein MST00_00800 [Tenericutes bacterium]|nr:hypothetical protein [Mycoplasmatota bacterium]